MARDLVTNLTINSQGFSSGLDRAKRELKAFDRSIGGIGSKLGGGLVGALGKAATGVGLAMGAVELFTTALQANGEVARNFNNALSASKTVVSDFFRSITTGDWSKFNGGLFEAWKKAKELSELRGDLSKSIQVSTTRIDDIQSEFDKAEAEMNNRTNSTEEITENYKKAKEYGNKLETEIEGSVSRAEKALLTTANLLGLTVDNVEDLRFLLQVINDPLLGKASLGELDKILKLNMEKNPGIKIFLSSINPYGISTQDINPNTIEEQDLKSGMTMEDVIKSNLHFTPKMKALMEMFGLTAKDIPRILELYRKYIVLSEEDVNSLTDQFDNLTNLKSKRGEIYNQNKDIEPDYLDAIDEARKFQFEKYKKENLGAWDAENWLNEELKGLHDEFIRKARGLDPVVITYKLEPIDEEDPDELPLPEKIINNESPISPILQDLLGMNDILQSATNGLYQLGSAFDAAGKSGKGLQRALVATSAAAAISGLIVTMVEKSKTSPTIWDWIAGIIAGAATIASVAAQLRSINAGSYATGGIIGGNSFSGDNLVANVNSGEMILNRHQQGNLFRMLNNGTGVSGGQVEFKIQGKELVGVLKNYNNKISKVV